jgi:hypothetical protein
MSRLKQVTQITSKTTSVRVNAFNGRITTVALTDGADTGFDFVVNNSKVKAISNVQLTVLYGGTTGTPIARIVSQTDGAFTVRISNAGTAVLNAVCSLNFGVV